MNTLVHPSRSLSDPRFHYVSAVATDIRRTLRKFRLLAYIRRVQA